MSANGVTAYLEKLFSAAGIKSAAEDAAKAESAHSLSDLLHTDRYTLISGFGMSEGAADLIRLVAALTSRRITDRFKIGRRYSDEEISVNIVGTLFGADVETVFVYYFDKDSKFLGSECLGDGTVNAASFIPRRIIDSANRLRAVSVTIAHNHPLGVAKPSGRDVASAANIKSILDVSGIECRHNYVVSGFDVCDTMALTVGRVGVDDDMIMKVSSIIKK